MDPKTHEAIDARWSGAPVEIGEGTAMVRLETIPEMRVDERGLVHGGFVFGAADHAAMLAVNEPTVVLGGAEVRFLAPVVVGDIVEVRAEVEGSQGRKSVVRVGAAVGDTRVFEGTFTCFVLDGHVLDGRV